MYIPNELDELYDRFSDKAYAPNALDGKTKESIALACPVMVDCPPCIEYHHAQAVKGGATVDEIKDAMGMNEPRSRAPRYRSFCKEIDCMRVHTLQ